jgi:DNA polymerase-3 subunit epsilon
MKAKLLILDTETGGLNPNCDALLSVGLVVWEDRALLAREEILIKGDPKKVSTRSLEINGIDLEQHNQVAYSEEEAFGRITRFLKKHFQYFPVIICGHNVGLDIRFLKSLFLLQGADFAQYFSHRILDTASILQYVGIQMGYDQEKLLEFSSSDHAFEFFKINIEEKDRHTALGDALATGMLLNQLLDWNPLKKEGTDA